jgi:hypothetical protein
MILESSCCFSWDCSFKISSLNAGCIFLYFMSDVSHNFYLQYMHCVSYHVPVKLSVLFQSMDKVGIAQGSVLHRPCESPSTIFQLKNI